MSCSKSDKPEVNRRLQQFSSMPGAQQRAAFALLKPEEKKTVWNNHLEKTCLNYSTQSKPYQLIRELINYNKPEHYIPGSREHQIAVSYFENQWLDKAEKVLNKDELFPMVFYQDNSSPFNDEQLRDCICAVNKRYTCALKQINIYQPNIPMYEYGSCSYNKLPCDVEGGCGFMGWKLCDGNRCSF